ncbi:AfsR/SARP family transcriptional regulator [Streptomyces sp. TG1A-8]|uniref:AfsR/SARP family transcriptional regulator n=1 Tax=Streptomyces sp. TG1A-8 TaxID=3051385 RepID=UPI00265BD86A|nr:AfsR/SARP family transcriptional regulator [Streptomyces sp. TG1A-8]MDO0926669.1 AfsR/SARP family transcriptional regulator [Streptomyces sp. TG1A-8]
MLDISVLGPLQVICRGVPVVPTAAKPRKVLALLALSPDRFVSVESLMEELWEERQPRSAATTLQTYILHLRGLLATALADGPDRTGAGPVEVKDVLVTKPGGYLLHTYGGRVDVREYEARAAAGHRAMAADDFAAAAATFREALDLWQGRTLIDVQTGPRLTAEALHLEESRLSLLGRRIEADLNLGRHHEILGELAGLCTEYPLDETFHGQYMAALCRTGRRGRALEVYARLRLVMKRELGLEPSPAVARLQHTILSGGPGIDWEPGAGSWAAGPQLLRAG